MPHTVKVNPKRCGNKLALEFVQDRGRSEPVKLEAFGMSDGTLRALGLLVAVFQRPVPSVLVIEEPEATMHPGALGAVLDLLRHAGRSTQVIVTTHSPEALDAKWIRNKHLRMMIWDAGVSRVARVIVSTERLSIRIDANLQKSLEREAMREERSTSYLAVKTIETMLRGRARKRAAIRVAVAEADERAFISQDAMDTWVSSWDSESELSPPEPDVFFGQSKR